MAKKNADVKEDKAVNQPDLSFLDIWAKNPKIKQSREQLEKKLNETIAAIKAAKPDQDAEKTFIQARQRLYGTFKSGMRTNAAPWKIRIDWMSTPNDFGNSRFRKNLQAFEKNPQAAMKAGLATKRTDAVGKKTVIVPLDERVNDKNGKPNKMHGKPLPEHKWIWSVGGLAIPSGKYDEEDFSYLRPCTITIGNKQADPSSNLFPKLELGKWYNASVNNKTDEKNIEFWELGNSTSTKFELLEDGVEIALADLPGYYEAFYAPLGEIESYHDTYAEPGKDKNGNEDPNKTVSRRVVMTKAQVIDIVPGEDGGNARILLDDEESMGFSDDPEAAVESITGWFPGDRPIPFGKNSIIYIWGDTTKMRRKDLATEEWLETWNLPTINIKGFEVIELVEPEIEVSEGGNVDDETEEDGEAEPNEPDISKADATESSDSNEGSEAEAEPEPKKEEKAEPKKKSEPKKEEKADAKSDW